MTLEQLLKITRRTPEEISRLALTVDNQVINVDFYQRPAYGQNYPFSYRSTQPVIGAQDDINIENQPIYPNYIGF